MASGCRLIYNAPLFKRIPHESCQPRSDSRGVFGGACLASFAASNVDSTRFNGNTEEGRNNLRLSSKPRYKRRYARRLSVVTSEKLTAES